MRSDVFSQKGAIKFHLAQQLTSSLHTSPDLDQPQIKQKALFSIINNEE